MKTPITTYLRRACVALNVLGMLAWIASVEPIDWCRFAFLSCVDTGDEIAGGLFMTLIALFVLVLNGAWLLHAVVRAFRRRWRVAVTLAWVVVAWTIFLAALFGLGPRLPGC